MTITARGGLKRKTLGDIMIRIVIAAVSLVCLYPFLYTVSMSVSDASAVIRKEVVLFPRGFQLSGYKQVLNYSSLFRSYGNTLYYTLVGTALMLVLTMLTAFPLARRKILGHKFLTIFFVLPMFIGGGMIPAFILVTRLGIYNTRWAMILPFAMSTWNLILTRQYIQGISPEIFEAAEIDGCGDLRALYSIVLPLSTPILAVIALYSAVGFWNSYMPALLYLVDSSLNPLQVLLVSIVIQNSQEMLKSMEGVSRSMAYEQIKYCVIVVSALPIMCLYPFLQKYFVKGVMIGSLKG